MPYEVDYGLEVVADGCAMPNIVARPLPDEATSSGLGEAVPWPYLYVVPS